MTHHSCSNDEFEHDDAVSDLTDETGETKLKCTHCGLTTTKGELMENNAESISAAFEEIS